MTAQLPKTLNYAYQLLEDTDEFYSDITADAVVSIRSLAQEEGLAQPNIETIMPTPTYAWDAMSGETLVTICIYQNGNTNLLSII